LRTAALLLEALLQRVLQPTIAVVSSSSASGRTSEGGDEGGDGRGRSDARRLGLAAARADGLERKRVAAASDVRQLGTGGGASSAWRGR